MISNSFYHGKAKANVFTLIELLVKSSHLDCDSAKPAHGQGKACFTLIELLVVIAMIAITTKSSIRVKHALPCPWAG